MDVSGHDPRLALSRGDDAWAIGADQPHLLPFEDSPCRYHVANRDPFGDADCQGNAGIGRFENGVGRSRRRDEDHGNIGAGALDCLLDRVENRDPLDLIPTLAGGDAGNDLASVISALTGVVHSASAGDSLNDYLCVFIYQD